MTTRCSICHINTSLKSPGTAVCLDVNPNNNNNNHNPIQRRAGPNGS